MKNINEELLTAYALNELNKEDSLMVKNAIENDSQLKKEFDEIKGFCADLSESLKEQETQIEFAEKEREQLINQFSSPKTEKPKKAFPWMTLTTIGSGFAAVAALMLFMMNNLVSTSDSVSMENEAIELSYEPVPEEVAQDSIASAKVSQEKQDYSKSETAIVKETSAISTNYDESYPIPTGIPGTKAPTPNKKYSKSLTKGNYKLAKPQQVRSRRPTSDGGGLAMNDMMPSGGHTLPSEPPRGGLAPEDEGKFNTETYAYSKENDFIAAKDDPRSTFSIDVDTATYSKFRSSINRGILPKPDWIRIEEFVNYFSYNYQNPKKDRPFGVEMQVASAPWNPKNRLVKVGIQAKKIDWSQRPSSNLVFLLDVSGSMNNANKLPLLKKSMALLVENLGENDRISIITYAGSSGLVLAPTPGNEQDKILEAFQRLHAGGSTNGGSGITLAYKIAKEQFIKGGINRVILATDGDFNVGTTDQGSLVRLVQDQSKQGIFLSILGYGMGNYKDALLKQISAKGNGNYAYIDSLNEAKKVLVEQAGGTMMTVAKDVKIQVEFNSKTVGAYRLIGYEQRLLKHQDFNNDKVDAGDIGSGHNVTAFYEIIPANIYKAGDKVDPLKYSTATAKNESNELMTIKLRFKKPEGKKSSLLSFALSDHDRNFEEMSEDYKFASYVTQFAMILRQSKYKGSANYQNLIKGLQKLPSVKENPRRNEFLDLVIKASKIK